MELPRADRFLGSGPEEPVCARLKTEAGAPDVGGRMASVMPEQTQIGTFAYHDLLF